MSNNGKGDAPRNCFSEDFRVNYDDINWHKDTKKLPSLSATPIEEPTQPKQKLTAKEKSLGRSSTYYEMSGQEQWDEDKRLGILDWDGT